MNNRLVHFSVLMISIITFPSCFLNKEIKWEHRFDSLPKELEYEILDDTFLFEGLLPCYISGDAIIKSPSFILSGNVDNDLYNKGIFIYGSAHLIFPKSIDSERRPNFDFSTVYKMIGQIRYDMNQEQYDSSYYFNFNPFYGIYYAKFHLKMEVLYLGKVKQRIPVFFNNEAELKNYMKKHHGKDYRMCAIPTYLITKVFERKRVR